MLNLPLKQVIKERGWGEKQGCVDSVAHIALLVIKRPKLNPVCV